MPQARPAFPLSARRRRLRRSAAGLALLLTAGLAGGLAPGRAAATEPLTLFDMVQEAGRQETPTATATPAATPGGSDPGAELGQNRADRRGPAQRPGPAAVADSRGEPARHRRARRSGRDQRPAAHQGAHLTALAEEARPVAETMPLPRAKPEDPGRPARPVTPLSLAGAESLLADARASRPASPPVEVSPAETAEAEAPPVEAALVETPGVDRPPGLTLADLSAGAQPAAIAEPPAEVARFVLRLPAASGAAGRAKSGAGLSFTEALRRSAEQPRRTAHAPAVYNYSASASLARFLDNVGDLPRPARRWSRSAGRMIPVSLDQVTRRIDWARGKSRGDGADGYRVTGFTLDREAFAEHSLSLDPLGPSGFEARRRAVLIELRGVFQPSE